MRKPKKKVILLGETNFLLDFCLERHKDCMSLASLAGSKEIKLVVPDYAFAEATAKLKDIEKRHIQQFEQSRLALKEISASVMSAAEREGIEASLIRATEAIRETIARAQVVLSRTRKFADVIPFTPEIHAASHLRRVAHLPPYDVKDLEIYESILAFVRLNRSPRFAIIFLERDAAHFDLPEIKTELAAAGVRCCKSRRHLTFPPKSAKLNAQNFKDWRKRHEEKCRRFVYLCDAQVSAVSRPRGVRAGARRHEGGHHQTSEQAVSHPRC